MKDYLQDLITHTNGLGDVDLIKVSGTDTETNINAISEKKTVIVSGVLNAQSVTSLVYSVCLT